MPRLVGGPVQALQIPSGIQGLVPGPVQANLTAHLRRPVQLRLLMLQGLFPLRQGRVQSAFPLLELPDDLQGEAQLPQQLDFPQGVHVLRGIVPIPVCLPLGKDQTLLLIVADVGPGHAQEGFHLTDVHTVRLLLPPLYRVKLVYSQAFSAKIRKFILAAAPAPLPAGRPPPPSAPPGRPGAGRSQSGRSRPR